MPLVFTKFVITPFILVSHGFELEGQSVKAMLTDIYSPHISLFASRLAN